MSTESSGPPKSRSVLFFLAAFACVSAVVFIGQMVAWFLEQLALESGTLAVLGNSGRVWFLVQAVIVGVASAIGSAFSRSRFRRFYQAWLLAVLVTLPGLGLRFLGPHQDQLGAALQIGMGLLGGLAILVIRKRGWTGDRRSLWIALTIVPLAIWPFLLWGALGSAADTGLNLLAGLSFGLLSAALVVAHPDGSFFQEGLANGVLLAILGSAFGYDGAQLLLLVTLPAFGFVIRGFAQSVPATILGAGLLAAAPLVFIDPTELTMLLGDLFPWAAKAATLMVASGLVLGLVTWRLVRLEDRPAKLSALVPLLGWALALLVYLGLGLRGNYGDRLFVILKDQADLSPALRISDRNERLTYVFKTLTEHAERSQAGLRAELAGYGIDYKPYYLVNAIEVDGSPILGLFLLNRPEIDRVLPSPRLRAVPQAASPMMGDYSSARANSGWNIEMIGADKVWSEFGITGEGIVIGQSDSGVDGAHPALRDAYRGETSGGDYNWYDPWNGTIEPVDVGGHGTHTLGIVLGSGGIGVAPGAQWIGCVNLARNLANPALYLDCMQFMLAPFPQGGDPFKDGDPTRGADVLNNSWGCPPLEGCDPEVLRPAVDALRAAGIFVAASAGNDGPACDTISNPISLYDSVFSVGAVDSQGNLANFSSRGPVSADGSNRIKPDIVAPGVEVFSSLPGGTYGPLSGTSMAGPHLAGAVALLWAADPGLVGDIDRTEQILIDTARPYYGARAPGECFSDGTPNDAYGYGLVDIYAAVGLALGK